MKRKSYIAPMSEIIRCGNFCETLPVYFSQEGPGDVGAKEMDFGNDRNKWGEFDLEKFNDVWER